MTVTPSLDAASTPVPPGSGEDSESLNARAAALLALMVDPTRSSRQRAQAREDIIVLASPLASRVAGRYGHRGVDLDDLRQVALIGLIKAVDGFDPARGPYFVQYAMPTMTGEIKRYFRDRAPIIRIPRRLQELRMDMATASVALTQELRRTPTDADLAAHLRVPRAEIGDSRLATAAHWTQSWSGPSTGGGVARAEWDEVLGQPDDRLDAIADRETLRPLIADLPARDRHILGLRFWRGFTQTEIAEELGISQMHVSRLLRRTLNHLAEQLGPASNCA